MNSEEFAAVVDSAFSDDLTTEQLSAVLDAVFEEPLSDEKFAEVIDAVLDSPLTDEQFAEVVDILESDTVTEEQVATAVDNILENGVTEDQATELATSEKVLESIDGDQATEIFEEIPVGDLSAEEEAALVEAVTDAPEEIKNAFEETIDVYAAGLDDYVAVGSSIDVGTRRSLIAATTVLSTVAVAPAASGGSGSGGGGSRGPAGGSGGSGGGSGGSGEGPGSGKKNDKPEEEEEEEAEIEGPEGDEEENNFTRNSIFKYEEGTMKKRFSPWGFIKKFSKETAAMAFTISGSVVVFATLSGETRKITLIATSIAFLVHYVNAMLKNDED
jgi:phenylpyruvate tautomerase PptA (4-oxalocrotonate tautomerase family)